MTILVNSVVSGGGGGSTANLNYLGEVATSADLEGLSLGIIGSTANVGATKATYILYELHTLPYSVEANWQPLQGTIPDGSVITLAIVEGKATRTLLVWVAAATEVTVSDGTTTVILYPSDDPHVLPIYDEPGSAAPSSVTIQRTSGTATTGRYSLEG
jgi:hypothetical protein